MAIGRKFEVYIKRKAKKKGLKASLTGSGAGAFLKGDVNVENYLIEAKSTTKKSISISMSALKKIKTHAFRAGKKPALVFTIDRGIEVEEWACIPLEHFLQIISGEKKDDTERS